MNMKKFGISLKEQYFTEILEKRPKVDFFEIHAENYLEFDSNNFRNFLEIAKIYPISIHCIGLSIGSNEAIDKILLEKIKKLVDIVNPILLSDHISWASSQHIHFHDLLPIPYTKESLNLFADKIKYLQDFFARDFLVENPSRYFELKGHEMSETKFINQLCEKAQCSLLLDINNIFVCSENLGFDAKEYLSAINPSFVSEIHLAGHEYNKEKDILVDTHSRAIRKEVIELLQFYNKKNKIDCPILVEWDNDLPEFDILYQELDKVKECLN